MQKDIETLKDIELLVNTFYDRVRADVLLGPVFDGVIQSRWPEHLEKMYRFWQTVLLGEHTYLGSPFAPHSKLPVEQKHFERWLAIFEGTVDELFTGEKAKEAKWRGNRMAEMFLYKIEHIRANNTTPIV